jgi:hypothetical protein
MTCTMPCTMPCTNFVQGQVGRLHEAERLQPFSDEADAVDYSHTAQASLMQLSEICDEGSRHAHSAGQSWWSRRAEGAMRSA